jgi:hypothetical protein
MNERNGVGWFRLGIWKLRCIRRGAGKGRCLQCEEENEIHILLKGADTLRWGGMF